MILEDKVIKKILESELHEINDNYVLSHRGNSYSRIIIKKCI